MSREQVRKLLSEPTEEDKLRAENEELHRVAEQATERGMAAEAEVERLRAQLLTCAEEWQKEAERRGDEVERLREDLAITERARKAERSERQQHEAEVKRLRAALSKGCERDPLHQCPNCRQALEEVGAS